MLREDLMKSRQAERLAKQKLMEMTSSPDFFSVSGRKLVVFGCIHKSGRGGPSISSLKLRSRGVGPSLSWVCVLYSFTVSLSTHPPRRDK